MGTCEPVTSNWVRRCVAIPGVAGVRVGATEFCGHTGPMSSAIMFSNEVVQW